MLKLRQILRSRRRLDLAIGLLVVLILLGFMVPPILAARIADMSDGNTRPLKLTQVIPLEGWFREPEVIKEYQEYQEEDIDTYGYLLKGPSPKPTLRGQKQIAIQRQFNGQLTQVSLYIALWQGTRDFLVVSLKVRPVE